MDRKKQINELYNKRLYSFFRTEFEGKFFESAFFEVFRKTLIKFVRVQLEFMLILDCLNLIRSDKNIYRKLSKESRKRIIQNIKGLEFICDGNDNILMRIISMEYISG